MDVHDVAHGLVAGEVDRLDREGVVTGGDVGDVPAERRGHVGLVEIGGAVEELHRLHGIVVGGHHDDLEVGAHGIARAITGRDDLHQRCLGVGLRRPEQIEQILVRVLAEARAAIGLVLLGASATLHHRQTLVAERRIAARVDRVHDVGGIVDVLEAVGVRDLLADGGGLDRRRKAITRAVEREGDVVLVEHVRAVERRDAEDAAAEGIGRRGHVHRVVARARARVGDQHVVGRPVDPHRFDHGRARRRVAAVALEVATGDLGDVVVRVVEALGQRDRLELHEDHRGHVGLLRPHLVDQARRPSGGHRIAARLPEPDRLQLLQRHVPGRRPPRRRIDGRLGARSRRGEQRERGRGEGTKGEVSQHGGLLLGGQGQPGRRVIAGERCGRATVQECRTPSARGIRRAHEDRRRRQHCASRARAREPSQGLREADAIQVTPPLDGALRRRR
ncbi:MAG: hypothetical protein IPK74_16545 [Deltaproteobacteria bacterium]|nr:hypothetical protein [Deltaproteobacteria bacterium]